MYLCVTVMYMYIACTCTYIHICVCTYIQCYIILLYITHPVVEPTIATQPMDAVDVSLNAMVMFTVVAGGDSLSYQWFMANGSMPIMMIPGASGATEATLTINSVTESNEGMYFCRVFNDAGSVESVTVALELCESM